MFLLIDKPKGITSHDVIDKVRVITGERKVGHAGTLDPLATGLLIVGVGRQSTKKLGKILKSKKTYRAEIILGKETDTLDAEGEIVSENKGTIPGKSEVEKTLKSFVGEIKQIPPKHSAVKVKGKKAYELARKGKKVKLEPRRVTVFSIELISYEYPTLKIRTEVSSGTYVRSLARDIGKKLGVGAFLNNLKRTRIGKHSIEDAVKLDELNKNNWEKFSTSINK